jgi:hypothetical protein
VSHLAAVRTALRAPIAALTLTAGLGLAACTSDPISPEGPRVAAASGAATPTTAGRRLPSRAPTEQPSFGRRLP